MNEKGLCSQNDQQQYQYVDHQDVYDILKAFHRILKLSGTINEVHE